MQLCDKGLELEPEHEALLKVRGDATKLQKEEERNRRKEAAAEKKRKAEEAKMLAALRERGVNVQRAAKGAGASGKDGMGFSSVL